MKDHMQIFIEVTNKKCISNPTTSHFHFTVASTCFLSCTYSFARPGRCVGDIAATAAEWLCAESHFLLNFLLFCVLPMTGLGILILKTEATISFGTSLLPKYNCINLTFMGPCNANVFSSITNKTQVTQLIYFCQMLYMFQVVPPPETCSAFHRNK